MAFDYIFNVVIGRRRGCSLATNVDEENYASADASGEVVFLATCMCGRY